MIKKLLFVIFALASFARADDYAMYFSYVGTATGAASSSAQKQIGTSVAYHKLAWNKSGTVSKCEVVVEQSATGTSSWTDLITAQTCTSSGTSTIFGASANYVRITFSTPVVGSGSVTASYSGYINLPLTDPPVFASFTAGSVPFFGAGGLLSEANSNFFWDNTNKQLQITANPASTNTILDVLKLTRSTTGTAGNGIGTALVLYAEDASGNIEEAGRFQASFPVAAHATQTGRVDITVMGLPGGSLSTAGSTAWGVNAGQSNTGAYQTATGASAGDSNSGGYQTVTGYGAGYSNIGNYQTTTGAYTGQFNTGASQTAMGYYAGNSNTGVSQTVMGLYAGYANTGASQTATGVSAGQYNTANYQTATGVNAGEGNTGANQTATGYGAGRSNNWPNITRIGYQSSVYFPDDAGSLKNITEASITAANTITYVAHGFGTPGGKVNVRYLLTGGTAPVGLVHNTIYQFTVTSADVLTLSGIAFPAAAFTGTLNNSTDTSNSIAIGVDANPTKANQAVLGPSSITETLLRGAVIGPTSTTAALYKTTTNCADGTATPADCAAAPAGAVIISATATSVVVNTTAVTADSNIILTRDDGLGTRLGVTCNTQSTLVLGTPRVTARTAATSFTVSIDVAPTTNPMCLSYLIFN